MKALITIIKIELDYNSGKPKGHAVSIKTVPIKCA